MNRRNFLGLALGVASAAVVGELPAIASGATDGIPAGTEGVVQIRTGASDHGYITILQPGQSLQDAINILPADGGHVIVPAGTYIVNEVITIPEKVTLVGQGNLSIMNCEIKAAAPIVLLGEHNLIQSCILKAEGKLDHFFEVKMDRANAAIGNIWIGLKERLLQPFRELAELIRA